MTVNAFIGSRALVSSAFENQDGELNHPLGEQVLGRIHYEANGTMAAQLYSAVRPRFAADDLAQGPSGRSARPSSYDLLLRPLSGGGKRAAGGTSGRRLFIPQLGRQPSGAFYAFSGDRLTLRAVPLQLGNGVQVGELVWQRTGASL